MADELKDAPRDPRDPLQRGGRATATLNYLVSANPIREWVEIKREMEQMVTRLEKLSRDCAQHELTLRIAGVTDDELFTALAADRERRDGRDERDGQVGGTSEPSAGADGRVRT